MLRRLAGDPRAIEAERSRSGRPTLNRLHAVRGHGWRASREHRFFAAFRSNHCHSEGELGRGRASHARSKASLVPGSPDLVGGSIAARRLRQQGQLRPSPSGSMLVDAGFLVCRTSASEVDLRARRGDELMSPAAMAAAAEVAATSDRRRRFVDSRSQEQELSRIAVARCLVRALGSRPTANGTLVTTLEQPAAIRSAIAVAQAQALAALARASSTTSRQSSMRVNVADADELDAAVVSDSSLSVSPRAPARAQSLARHAIAPSSRRVVTRKRTLGTCIGGQQGQLCMFSSADDSVLQILCYCLHVVEIACHC